MTKHAIRTIALLIAVVATAAADAQVFSIKKKSAINWYMQARHTYTLDHRIECLNSALKKEKRFVEAYWLMAETHLAMNNMPDAITALETADSLALPYPGETKCRLAELYYDSGEYDKALEKISQVTDPSLSTRCRTQRAKYENAKHLYANPIPFEPRNLKNVNTVYDDYFPSVTADGSLISTTVLVPAVRFFNEPDVQRFQEDMYVSHRIADDWSYSEPLSAPINTQGNEGSQSFSADGRYMFYVQCDNRENIGSCDIYYSIRSGDTWTPPMNLGEPANSRYWESNPVLSASADRLYFTSKRPGGIGEIDIWCVDVAIAYDGRLVTSNARPLGTPVNTPRSEFAPFIHADNRTLYFASNGHNGLGGNDIYLSHLDDDGRWSTPVNIGYPINTHGDESGFVVSGRGDRAYFASDNIEQNGNGLDIYEISLPEQLRPTKQILYSPGRVFNAHNGHPLEALVEIFDQTTGHSLFKSLSDKKYGDFTALLPADGIYGLSVTQPGYLLFTAEITQPGDSILVPLQPIRSGSTTTLKNLFFDYDSDTILPTSHAEIERLLFFLAQNPTVKINIVGHTDNRGSDKYNLNLSSRRADSLRKALIEQGVNPDRITSEGRGSTQPVATNDTDEGRALNRRVEVVIQ